MNFDSDGNQIPYPDVEGDQGLIYADSNDTHAND